MTQPLQPQQPLQPIQPIQLQQPPPPVKKDRRVLRAALRWTAAVVVFAAVGAGAAYGVTRQDRGDLPGLATESDGRWDYPAIEKPPLPEGAPAAFAEENSREEHFADPRGLLLPAPKGARTDKEFGGKDGRLSVATYLKLYEKDARADVELPLGQSGLRQIVGRAWTMPDGTRTRIYLLQFNTAAFAREHQGDIQGSAATFEGAHDVEESYDWTGVNGAAKYTALHAYDEQKPYGKERIRLARIQAGDILAFVVQSGAHGVPLVPFQQTVVLQNQLLG